jgi:hypothetical protein
VETPYPMALDGMESFLEGNYIPIDAFSWIPEPRPDSPIAAFLEAG